VGFGSSHLPLSGVKFAIISSFSLLIWLLHANRIKKIIVDKLSVGESEIVPEASLTNDLGADSLDTVELIMEFEKEFDISIPDHPIKNRKPRKIFSGLPCGICV